MSKEITIFVHDFNNITHTIVIHPWEIIDTISKKIGIKSTLMHFFNGKILIGAFTFGFYKISNGDHIYSIPFGPTIKKFKQFKPQDLENTLLSKSKTVRIQAFMKETARLKDQFFQKLEGTMSTNRKLLNRLLLLNKDEPETVDIPTVVPPKSTSPSNGELPTFWAEPFCQNGEGNK